MLAGRAPACGLFKVKSSIDWGPVRRPVRFVIRLGRAAAVAVVGATTVLEASARAAS